ncbi:uncharacterized protein LOC132313871 [Cornus florida]|uniref:uncharacterized protein LOC132313871 n=1 Tax=Cornus florida TaxID=4283 RepID=UPI00289832F6|nr:uncharacterized protein LOC132313871 [Cornus florida]
MDRVMEKMSDACREKTDRIERAIVVSSSSNMKTGHEVGQVEVNSLYKTKGDFKLCCYILNKLEGVDMKQYAKVTQMLRNDELWMDFFLNDLPDDKRMDIRTIIDLYDDGDEENECVIIIACMLDYYKKHYEKRPCRDSLLIGKAYIMEILHGHESRCFENFRMSTPVFLKLCGELKSLGLKDSIGVSVYEQVGIFLLILAHNERNRVVAEIFQHSTYTISKYFHAILQKVYDLGKQIIVGPDLTQVSNHIRKSKKYHPFFSGLCWAIDGTHVHVNVPMDQQIPFCGRKGDTTQNVMAVCDFDMMFTYVVARWEGLLMILRY